MADPCQVNVIDIANANFSVTTPSDNDIVMFIVDGTLIFRSWRNCKTSLAPAAFQAIVTDGAHVDGEAHTGDGTLKLPDTYKGFNSVGFTRNGILQPPFAVPNGYYYAWDAINAVITFTPALAHEEFIQIEPKQG